MINNQYNLGEIFRAFYLGSTSRDPAASTTNAADTATDNADVESEVSTSANPPTTTTENNGQTDVGSTIATTTLTTTMELTTTKTSTTRKAPITGIRNNLILVYL